MKENDREKVYFNLDPDLYIGILTNVALLIQNFKKSEWTLLHDFYRESLEPDAPKNKFENLCEEEKVKAIAQYQSDNYKSLWSEKLLIGFVGFFPDDDNNINLFCVISPDYRGKGYFSAILRLSLDYCRTQYVGYKYIRGLTRKENTASIRGLERFSFIKRGSLIEDVQPDVVYEEYLLPI